MTKIIVTLQIYNYVYTEQSLKCISNWYTALLMHAYLNSYSIKKVLITCFPRLKNNNIAAVFEINQSQDRHCVVLAR